jgi:hypothetical protein
MGTISNLIHQVFHLKRRFQPVAIAPKIQKHIAIAPYN